jgi:hypothetical protein
MNQNHEPFVIDRDRPLVSVPPTPLQRLLRSRVHNGTRILPSDTEQRTFSWLAFPSMLGARRRVLATSVGGDRSAGVSVGRLGGVDLCLRD